MKYLRLDKILSDVRDDETVLFDYHTFNGGESHIRITGDVLNEDVMIECLAMRPNAPMLLMLAYDALSRLGASSVELCLPYVPYGRQDAAFNEGEALSIKVFGDVLWSTFNRVWVLDPHSPTTVACLDNCFVINRTRLLEQYLKDKEHMVLISADAGALKKTYAIAKKFGHHVVEASKRRDPETGEILGVTVHDDVAGMDCVVIDDICDGGATFVALGEQLKLNGAVGLHLYVSHGIFSMGQYKLEDIYTTITATTLKRSDLPMVQYLPLCKEDVRV